MTTDIFNSTTTLVSQTHRILDFINYNSNFFIGIGKRTSWTKDYGLDISDTNPPNPGEEIVSIPDVIIYKKIKKIAPALVNRNCYELDFETADYNVIAKSSFEETQYSILDPSTILNNDNSVRVNPTHIYISSTVDYEDYDTDSFRAIGFYTNLKFKTGVDISKLVFTPSEVESSILHWASYSTPVIRDRTKSHTIEFILSI